MQATHDQIPGLAGYSAIELFYRGSRTLVYRAVRTADRIPVILKRLQHEAPSLEEQMRLRNQYLLVKQLNIPGIVKVLELVPCENGDVLVMEDMGELPLSDYLQTLKANHQPLAITDFLSIALQLSITLGHLHSHRIIHKDIKPANILIDPDSKQIRLIDFSIASQLSHHTQELQHPNQLEGTLAYLSPEQTGRMNRSIDYRSDFYSLGVTFYELLTGQVPFAGEDALEIVYSHLAKQPPALQSLRPEIPSPIAQIITKLMAKNAEDRYQSAKGLQTDLQHCWDEFNTTGTIAAFEIGRLDRIAQLNISDKLYGRNSQLQTLLAAFERARQGSCELVVIGGYSGIGKTALIHELFKPITASHAHFISSKCDQLQRDVPYACVAEAYGKLIRQILGETQEQVEYWRDRFSVAVGANGQAVIDIIPELEWLIGQQPPLPEVSPTEAENCFHQAFSAFMLAASMPEAPLVEFMDDLQWAEATTLSTLPTFLTDPENKHRLLILAYRDNEVDATHPLMQALAQLEAKAFRFEHITLEPLSLHDVMQFVADTLRCHYSMIQPLAKLLYDKTQGNPFFLTQLLKSLHSENLITFNFETNAWQWDIKQIHQHNITENVAELMIAKLQKLSIQTQRGLQLAACIGNQFDLKTLSTVSQLSVFQTLQALWSAIDQGFILPLDQYYQVFMDEPGTVDQKVQSPKFKFFHDRVQQAAYALIAEDEKQLMHLTIARLLQQHLSEVEVEANIFEIVNHWNTAIDLVVSETERSQLVQLNRLAALRAKSSAAYQSALHYLQIAIRCLPADCWQRNYHWTLALYEEAAQAAYLTGQFAQLDALCSRVSANSLDLLDRVRVCELWIQGCMAQNRMTDAVNFAIVVLQSLGISIRQEAADSTELSTIRSTLLTLSEAEVEALAKLPRMRDHQYLAALRICGSVEVIAYYSSPELHRSLVETAIHLSMLHGNAPESVFFYAVYGQVLCSYTDSLPLGLQFGRLAAKLLNTVANKDLHARTLVNLEGFVNPWGASIRHTIPQLLKAYQLGIESEDLEFAAIALHCYCVYAYFAGNKLDSLNSEMRLWGQKIDSLHQEAVLNFHAVWEAGVSALIAQPQDVYRLIQEQSDFAESNQTQNCHRLLNLLTLSYGFGKYEVAIAAANQLKVCINGIAGMYCVAIYNLYDSLTKLAICSNPAESDSILESVVFNQNQMQIWAQFAPMNFQHKYELVEAERCRIVGDTYAAMEYYDRAIAGALENGYIQEAALANELAAQFYFNLNKPKFAQAYLTEAYQQYQQWGATAKVRQLEAQYPSYFSALGSAHPATTNHIGSSSMRSESLDLATILKATEAISSELVLNQLLDRLLHIILENAGAQQGCIVLDREGELFIEVADTDQEKSTVIVEAIPLAQSQNVPLTVLQYVARTQAPIVSGDAASESIYALDPYILKHQPQSLLCTPIVYQAKAIGLVYLENNLVKRAFTSTHLETVRILTGQAAIAIENAKLYAREQERSFQLEQSQRRLNLLIQQSPIAFLEWNTRFEIQSWNKAAEATFGYSAEEAIGQHFRMIVPEEFQPYVDEAATKILQQTGGTHAVHENIRKNGERITCEWFNAPFIAQDGEILGGVSIVMDVTDRKRMELAIQEKNQSLEQALTQLQQAQMQMVQNEKMSALGNLVAGVAHEINNPLGFLTGSITNATEFVQDLLEYVNLYQQHHPNAAPLVEEFADEIDVEFLKMDLPKLLCSMQTATERIRAISTSLRTFSRADTEHTLAANLHEGIDSTILILKYRLKANDQRPAIEVVTNYGEIPLIECFPGQINQVFMNIFANAIDMFDEMAQHASFTELEAHPQKMTIQTARAENNQVEIRIRDNGKGMSDEVKSRIFDHLFTTKGIGKGTGLGLAIARQIVVEKHQGSIEVHSEIDQGTEFVISLPIKQEIA